MAEISFVTTVFNKAAFLPRLFENLVRAADETERAEFVFVDDGSSDGSAALLRDFAAREPRAVVITQVNAGPAVALNRGVRAARYSIIKPMDADDLLYRGGVALLLQGLARGAELATAGKALSDLDAFAAHGDAVDLGFVVEDRPLVQAITQNWTSCTGALFRREAFLAVGGCDERVFVQDYSFIRRMTTRYRVARTLSVVGIELDGPGRLSANQAQVLHDINAANYGLVTDFPELPGAIRRLCFRASAKRAWKWDRRHNGAAFGLALSFWICLLAYVPLFPGTAALTRATLAPFRVSRQVRSDLP